MRFIRTTIAVTTVATAALIFSAATSNGSATPEPTKRIIEASYAKSYGNFAELRANSSAVLKIVAGSQQSTELETFPITVTTAKVTQVLWGRNPGQAIEIRQLGNADATGENLPKLLVPGKEYLVFLAPSTGATDAAPNRYLITGGAGLYELNGDRYDLRGGNKPPAGSPHLPTTLSTGNAAKAMTS